MSRITALLTKDFLALVLIAILISFPLAWWVMKEWLTQFAYRIELRADIFVIAGASTVLITLFTISFQSVKAALANPVKSLRNE